LTPLSIYSREAATEPSQGVSPGFDFRADTSREGAADAANLPPLRGCDMDEHEPSARALGYLLTPLRGLGNHARQPWATFCRRFAAKQFIHTCNENTAVSALDKFGHAFLSFTLSRGSWVSS